MAGAAVNKLGELFIQFGMKGGGELMKGLRGISADFLLMKNAGMQALNPLIQLSKQSALGVVAFDKLNSVTGISVKNLQRLAQWSEKNRVDFNMLTGQLGSLQQQIIGIRTGTMGINKGWSMLGGQLFVNELNYEDPVGTLQKIISAVKRYKNEAEQVFIMNQLGLSPELLYREIDFSQVEEGLLLTEKETDNLRIQRQEWDNLAVAVEAFGTKFVANQKWINDATNALNEYIRKANSFLNEGTDKKLTTKIKESGASKYLLDAALFASMFIPGGAIAGGAARGLRLGSLLLKRPGLIFPKTLAGKFLGSPYTKRALMGAGLVAGYNAIENMGSNVGNQRYFTEGISPYDPRFGMPIGAGVTNNIIINQDNRGSDAQAIGRETQRGVLNASQAMNENRGI